MGRLLGGWTLAPLFTAQSGVPLAKLCKLRRIEQVEAWAGFPSYWRRAGSGLDPRLRLFRVSSLVLGRAVGGFHRLGRSEESCVTLTEVWNVARELEMIGRLRKKAEADPFLDRHRLLKSTESLYVRRRKNIRPAAPNAMSAIAEGSGTSEMVMPLT